MKPVTIYFCLCFCILCAACKKKQTPAPATTGIVTFMRISPPGSTSVRLLIYTEEMWLAKDTNGYTIAVDTIAPSTSYWNPNLLPGNYIYYTKNYETGEFQITAGGTTNITLRF